MVPGQGVAAVVDGREILAGNQSMLEQRGIAVPERAAQRAATLSAQGCTLIFVAADHVYAGLLALADTLRTESRDMVAALQALGVRPALLTGDHRAAAAAISGQLGITDVHADCLPEEKLQAIAACQRRGEAVCMVGDGINDAPSLKTANVGIAMGGVGSDITVDAADIVLVNDDVKELPHLLALSRHMMRVIKANLTFSMALNFLALALAALGVLNPVVGALVHNAGSVVVMVHSSFLLKWRWKQWP